MEGSATGESVKDAHTRFKEFKQAHKRHMAAQLEHTYISPNGASTEEDLQGNFEKPSFWNRFIKWETLTMSDGTVIQKGFVVSPALAVAMAGILLTAFLGVLGYAYKSSQNDSRETLKAITRMETLLDERTRTFERDRDKAEAKLDNEIKIAEIRREREMEKDAKLLAALRQKGIIVD